MIRLVLAALLLAYGITVGGSTIDNFTRVIDHRITTLETTLETTQ